MLINLIIMPLILKRNNDDKCWLISLKYGLNLIKNGFNFLTYA